MKRFLLSFVSLLMMLCGTAFGGTITFGDLELTNGTQYTDPFDGGDFTVTFGGSANDGKYYTTGAGIRVYGGGTMTIAAKTGKLASLTITYDGSYKPDAAEVVSVGTYDPATGVWTGSDESVVFTRPSGSGHWRVKSIAATLEGAVTVATPVITPNGGTFFTQTQATITCETEGAQIFYTMNGEDPNSTNSPMYGRPLPISETLTLKAIAVKGEVKSAVASATFTKIESYATLAALNALADKTPFAFTGEAFVVAKPTAKYVYIHDNSGNSLIYDGSGEKTAAAEVGKYITANWTGKVSIFNKLFELVPDQAITVKDEPAQPVFYPETPFSEEAVNSVITLKKVDSYSVSGKNITIHVQGDDKNIDEAYGTKGYNQFGITIAAAEGGKLYDIIGAVGKYNDQLQFWPIEIKEHAEDVPEPDPDFYVVGSMSDWKIAEANKMTMQEIVENEQHIKEFTLNMTLAAGAEFKVASSTDGSTVKSWFPAEGDNYAITEAGDYTIYCRPNLDGGEGWYAKCLKAVKKGSSDGLLKNMDFSSVEGWTAVVSGEYRDYGNGLIGTYKVYGDNAATVDETHLATEYCFGFECRWNTNFASYTQETAELAPGFYKLQYDVENVNGKTTAASYENRFTVTVGDKVYTDESIEWMRGKSAWTTHSIVFEVTEAGKATVSLGYGTGSNNFGSANTPILYVSHLSLEATEAPDPTPDPDAAYDAAIAAIGEGGTYFISTDVDGTKYYITSEGKLTSVRAEGAIFTVTKTDGGAYKTYGYKIDGGGTRFTNAPKSGDYAVLNVANFTTTDGNRNDWEAQVLFLADGKYAIRACNTSYGESGWADCGRVFFTWKKEDAAVIPQYTYDMVYQWNFEAATPINVSYQLAEADGTPVGDPVVVKQEANSEVVIPASFTSVFFYDYAAEGTIGDSDCTILVKRTFKAGVVHALTDLSNSKAYTMRCERGAMLSNGSAMVSTANTKFASSEPGQFAVVYYDETDDETANGSYYLYSVADKQFVTNNGALAAMPTHGVFDAIKMEGKTDPYFFCYFTVAEGTNYGLNTNGNDPYGYVINTWMNADGGNQYYFIEAADFDATEALKALNDFFHPSYYVTYVVKDAEGNVLFTSEPAPAVPGQKITTLPADYQRGFTTYNEVDVTITDAETTVEFTATPNFPFEIAPSFADAKWYNMTIRSDYWVAMDETEPYYPKADKDLDADASKWAFGGDAYKGVFLYNRAAGEGKTLTRDGDMAVMREGDFRWEIFSNNGGFVLRPMTGDDRENMWINQSGGSTGPLKFWNSANGKTDNGSTFRITEATPVYAITCLDAENGSVVADKAESKAGETIQLTITPAEGYELDQLSVVAANGDVVAVSRTYTFEMPAAKVQVTATFKEKGDEESPKNITDEYLKNADLAVDPNVADNGWTLANGWRQDYQTAKDDKGVNVVEFYSGWGSLEKTDFAITQNVSLPAGDYRIVVNAFYREGNDGDGTNANKAWIFAGEKQQNVYGLNQGELNSYESGHLNGGGADIQKAANAFATGNFVNAFDFSLAKDTTIELGFKGKFDAMRSWCIFGPVQLWKYSLKDYLVAYNEKAIEVEALIKSGKKMGAAELAALQASLVDESAFTLGSEVVAAIDVMNAAIEAANASIAGYAKLTAALEKGNEYKAHSVDAEAKTAYDEAVAEVVAAYDANTVADLAAALATVEAALPALAKTQTLAGSDLTVFITNPEINGADGWTIDRPVGGNGPLLGGNSFEYWAGNASDRAAASFDYWQEITGLPNGVYTVSADMYNSLNGEGGDYTVFAPTSGVYAASGESEVSKLVDVDGTELINYTTGQVFVLDGKLRLGVKNVVTPMAARWFVADNFKLTLVRPLAEDFDAAYEYALASIEDGGDYFITTDVEGTKYYITTGGKLTSDREEGGIFTLSKVAGGAFKDYGFYIDGGGTRFTNTALSDNKAVLDVTAFATSTSNRAVWEAQVLFLQDGKYAIRATNATPGESSWEDAGRVFFTWKVEDTEVLPQYTYDQVYQWNFEVATTINVSYQLAEADGTPVGKPVVMKQEANSAISVPASLTNQKFYSYAVEGTIGSEDCTITITRTMKEGVVHTLADLSNSKAYTIYCDRGAFLTKDGYLASTAHNDLANAEPANFAVISYQDNYYLYSVADSKFVTNNGALADVPTNGALDAIQMEAKDDPYFFWYFTVGEDTNYGLNTNGNDPYGYVINSWMNADPGNQYYMIEAADFDATQALTLLEKGPYLVELQEALAANVPNPTLAGDGLFQKPQAAYDAYEAVYNAQKAVAESEASTSDELQAAYNALVAAVEAYAAVEVNKPEAGTLYQFQQKSSSAYLSMSADGVKTAETAQGFEFVETEKGYYLCNELGYLGISGKKDLKVAEGDTLFITVSPVEKSEDGVLYYTLKNASNTSGSSYLGTQTNGVDKAVIANQSASVERSHWIISKYVDTAISRIADENEGVVVYDLNGRRVSRNAKGVLIINGKKVMRK